jgi:hypothetical protein
MIQRNRLAGLILLLFFFSACGPDTIFLRPALDTPVQHVKNGNNLLARGKIDAAYAEFIRANNLDRGYAPAYVGMALVQGHRGDVDGGFKTLNQARELATTPEETKVVDQGYKKLEQIQLDRDG